MRASRIAGLGHFVPERVVTNDDLSQWMETSDEWIRQRTGIEERRWVEGDVGASDLALPAAKQALAEAGIEASELDMVVFATLSPDINFPGSSCLLQAKLGVPGIATLDIRNQCTGFVYGLAVADQFVRTGMMKHVLVVGGEVHSSGLDISTRGRDVAVLFGDGAGAAVVSASTKGSREILGHKLHADGTHHDILMLGAPASGRNPRLTPEMLEEGLHFPKMNGRAVFKHAATRFPQVIVEVLEAHGYGPADIGMLIPHQANLRISEFVAKRLGLSPDRVHNNIQRYGNTTAASIPIALHEAVQGGRIKDGDLVVLAAFGAGLTWGASLIRW
ncbi:MAG: 3-oxoacyl-ACP synthase [Deltaproteobacteria bacterium]|nr:3-oxoacyl-ACP synthase [Deltaproteobacteria bacterium]